MSDFEYSEYTVDYISGVMSLRKPQRRSLEILDDILGGFHLSKESDKESLKHLVHSKYPIFTDFSRDFPSFTFALATGVGKTR